MMKHRVAHTLSTALSSNDGDGVEEFNALIRAISDEYNDIFLNRSLYILPATLFVVALFLISIFNMDGSVERPKVWEVIISLLSASVVDFLSILINSSELNFEEFKSRMYYFLLGLERVFCRVSLAL